MRRKIAFSWGGVIACAGFLLFSSALGVSQPAKAATFNIVYNSTGSFGTANPAGPDPFLTAVFDDGGTAGSVSLLMTVAPTVDTADMTGITFNLSPLLDPTDLVFTRTGGTGPSAADTDIFTSVNGQNELTPSTGYDIFFDLPPPPGTQADRMQAGETLAYDITGIATLIALDFNFLSVGGGPAGEFVSASRWQDTVGGESDKIGGTVSIVPLPAALPLFGTGLGILGFLGWRRRRQAQAV